MRSVLVGFALFAGIVAYAIHRSLLYPFFEWFFTSKGVTYRQRFSLISKNSCKDLKSGWSFGDDNTKSNSRLARHLTTWNDYAHLDYTSALCIALGALTREFIVGRVLPPSWPLVGLGLIFLAAGVVSDWRLRAFKEYLSTHTELNRLLAPFVATGSEEQP